MMTVSNAAPKQLFPLVRQLSYRLTPILLKTAITPNQITALSLLLGVLSAVCFLFGDYVFGIIGAIFLTLSYTMDNCDGEVARSKNMSSEFGAKFDDMADWLVDACFFAALGYGTSLSMAQPFWLWLGLVAALGAFIDYVVDLFYYAKEKTKDNAKTREERSSDHKKPADAVDWIIYIFHKLSRADFCIIVLLLAILDLTWGLLPFAAIGAQLYWITDLFERSRGFRT